MKYSKKIIYLILFSFFFYSCGVTQKYERKQMYAFEKYKGQKETSKDTFLLKDYSLYELFKDTILKKYISEGLKQNINLLQANKRVKQAEAYVKQARVSVLPSLNAGVSYAYTTPPLTTAQTRNLPKRISYNDFKVNGVLSWEIDIWGKLQNNKKAFVAKYLQSNNAHRLAQSQLIAGIATNYYNLLALDARIKVLYSNIENSKKSIETAKALKDAGMLTEVAVKQYEAQLYSRQALLADTKLAIEKQENALCILLAKPPQKIERSTLNVQELPKKIAVGVPIKILDNRPDVLMAEFGLINAFEMVNIARKNRYPSLSITATGGFNSNKIDDWFKPDALFANLIGNLTQPIFNHRKLKTQKEVKEYEKQIAYLNYKQTVLNAYQEISNTLSAYNTYKEKDAILIKQEESLAKAVEYSEILQQQGMANYIEVITAKDNALNTELNLIINKTNLLNTVVMLYRALGGGS